MLKKTPEFASLFLIALTQPDSELNCWPKMEMETLLNILDKQLKQTGTLNLHVEFTDLMRDDFYSQTHSDFQEFPTTLERMQFPHLLIQGLRSIYCYIISYHIEIKKM